MTAISAYQIAALVAVAVLLVIAAAFVAAKGEKKRIVLVNSEGSRVAVEVEVANDSATRAKGLMGRDSLGESEGMLFIFGKPAAYSFWMFNTTIPLDAIFFSEDGRVADVIRMEPCGLNMLRCRTYVPRAKAKYVLEVNSGFSERNRIAIGNSSLVLAGAR